MCPHTIFFMLSAVAVIAWWLILGKYLPEQIKLYFELKKNEGPCCDSPGKEKCDQCQEIGLANPQNHW